MNSLNSDTTSTPGRLYVAVAEEVLHAIAIGQLQPGDRLPDERALAGQCSVSRATVREALLVLKLSGVIDVRRGAGCFVKSTGRPLGAGLALPTDTVPQQMLEVRRLLEPGAARLCAATLSREECHRLAEVFEEARARLGGSAPDSRERFSECNQQFHREIAHLSGNAVLADLIGELMDPVNYRLWSLVDSIASCGDDVPAAQLDEHRAILDAITDGDADRAERAMARHIEALTERVFGAVAHPIRRAALRTPNRRSAFRRP
jgi:GntR family transcriptional regulator, transcriptional repressor for pyruvate dehydrogenase complex